MNIFENTVFCVQKVTEYGCSSLSFLMVAIPGISRMSKKVVLLLFICIKFLFNFQHQVLGVFGWGVFCSKLLFLPLRGKCVQFILTPASPGRVKLWFVFTHASPSEEKSWFFQTHASPSEDKLWFVLTHASPSEDKLWFVLTPASQGWHLCPSD